MTPWVVDASVVAKWFVPEENHVAARSLLDTDAPLHAPDLVLLEVGNALWKWERRGPLAAEEATQVGAALLRMPLRLHPSASLLGAALEVALACGCTVYDGAYIALAGLLDGRLVTCDQRLVRLLAPTPFRERVVAIERLSKG